jgi:hypothetical protein
MRLERWRKALRTNGEGRSLRVVAYWPSVIRLSKTNPRSGPTLVIQSTPGPYIESSQERFGVAASLHELWKHKLNARVKGRAA